MGITLLYNKTKLMTIFIYKYLGETPGNAGQIIKELIKSNLEVQEDENETFTRVRRKKRR